MDNAAQVIMGSRSNVKPNYGMDLDTARDEGNNRVNGLGLGNQMRKLMARSFWSWLRKKLRTRAQRSEKGQGSRDARRAAKETWQRASAKLSFQGQLFNASASASDS